MLLTSIINENKFFEEQELVQNIIAKMDELNSEIPDKEKVRVLFEKLNNAFRKEETSKEKIISIMKEYLPNFEHIETGKSLDSKM